MFLIGQIPAFKITSAVKISVLAILCAGVSIIFCVMLHQSEHLYKKFFKNPYVRIFAGGCFVLILTPVSYTHLRRLFYLDRNTFYKAAEHKHRKSCTESKVY